MTRRAQYALLVGLISVAVGALVARGILGRKRSATHAVVVFDRSDSTRDICDAVVGVAAKLLGERKWTKGSSIVLLATGDTSTLGEPLEIYRFSDFRRKRTVEGKAASARHERELLAGIRFSCQAVSRTSSSPIYLAVRRGAELLSAADCAPSRCSLAIISDGEETIESGLVAAIRQAKKGTSMPSAIANDAFRVEFCGLAETVSAPAPPRKKTRGRKNTNHAEPRRDGARADRLAAVWTNLFSVPSAVDLIPVCPKRKDG